MKLYVWRPNGHGAYSYFVIAESEEQALKFVEKHMEEDKPWGWGTDYYYLEVFDSGTVVEHEND